MSPRGVVALSAALLFGLSWASDENAENEVQRLMNAGLPFAEKMLAQHGEFFPFGAAMLRDGRIRVLGTEDAREQPPVEEVLAQLLSGLRRQAVAGETRAAAIFANVLLRDPQTGEEIQALHVGLEHRSGYCVDVYFPHRVGASGPELGESFAGRRAGEVFDTCR